MFRVRPAQIQLLCCGSRRAPTIPHFIAQRTVKTSTVDWKPIKSSRSPNEEQNNNNGSKRGNFAKYIFLSLMIAMPIVSFKLGMWQYRRLSWKNKLVATCEDRLISEPLNNQTGVFKMLFKNTNLDKIAECDLEKFREFTDDVNQVVDEQFQYKRINLTGQFDHEHELFVGPRMRDGQKGYLLFTPFVLQSGKGPNDLDARKFDGKKVLIERGWISADKVLPMERALTHLSLPQGIVQLECVIKVSRNLSATQWERDNKDGRLWQVIDFPEMCKEVGVAMPILFQQMYDLKDHKYEVIYEDDKSSKEKYQKGSSSSSWFSKLLGRQLEPPATEPAPVDASQKFTIKDTVIHATDNSGTEEEEPEYTKYQFVTAGVPLGKNPKIEYKNDHLQYMVTWFGLSFLSSIFLIVALRKFSKPNVISQEQLKRDKLRHASRNM
ncbi:Cytochrome oxidase assembly protein SHY1 [Hanseniaspora osmophila]|uniref:SURF1-like protein n=1 Tax=Hanseniaspora osmophila TaxID=56408 RepID=A0A1E5R547_9ASCO|nr:Cytochrome oxidase assembly protein SHY1 [Hanseniaspora osmophila]